MLRSAIALAWLVPVLVTGCSKPEEPKPTAPWLATASANAPSLRARYVVAERCRAELELRAKEATRRGAFRVCRGELDVDLLDLTKTRGTLSIDVASIEMRAEGDAGRSDDDTQRAQNWLDVGASRPEAERERLRWATFTLGSLADVTAPAAHAGKREPAVEPGIEGDAGAGERRTVAFSAKGSLELHGVRVEVELPLRASFEYATKAGAAEVPERVSIESRRPLVVSLASHDIKPRDAAGVFMAQEMKLLGRQVGKDARVSFAADLARAR